MHSSESWAGYLSKGEDHKGWLGVVRVLRIALGGINPVTIVITRAEHPPSTPTYGLGILIHSAQTPYQSGYGTVALWNVFLGLRVPAKTVLPAPNAAKLTNNNTQARTPATSWIERTRPTREIYTVQWITIHYIASVGSIWAIPSAYRFKVNVKIPSK
ncbi:hypothetical protein DFP72DRAFT_850900 [Ephemerocybe angulata]|uniref:Uncharacterized protein n=1 Tax=Ephemerocybe angulata TaxID=980116 RepID=A0A8H6HT11_9AGAR|nr:hypothetical protein DFP72DRAFT_850900 [Tulosesus angulatus]